MLQKSNTKPASASARERIFIEILREIEDQRIVPGQRLAETDLVPRFGVSRNAVREGIQLLAGQGIVDLSPNKSPTIRRHTLEEAMGVLDISQLLTGLLARSVAQHFTPAAAARLAEAKAELDAVPPHAEKQFSRAQRHFISAMLEHCGNQELRRIYPMVGLAVFSAQFRSPDMMAVLREGLDQIYAATIAGNPDEAERAGRDTIARQRPIVQASFA